MFPAASSATSGQTDREQVVPTLAKLAVAIDNLGTLLTDNIGRNAGSTRDSKQSPCEWSQI